MKNVLSKIDRALKDLYNLDSLLQAEHFLLEIPPTAHPQNAPPGALYIEEPSEQDDSLGLGIYLSPQIRLSLDSFSQWANPWNGQQIATFGIAAEEVSHFHYVAHHVPRGRAVSQLELEYQGEVDKFLITFFALKGRRSKEREGSFLALIERFFENFRWFENLTEQQKQRYESAHLLAKAFLLKHSKLLDNDGTRDRFLQVVRNFYRMGLPEKISQATR